MKKNKNEKNDQFGSYLNNGFWKADIEDNFTGIDYSHFPVDEDMYLNEEESFLKILLDQENSYTDEEEKQDQNHPYQEKTGYSINTVIANLNQNADGLDNYRNSIEEQFDEFETDYFTGDGNNLRDPANKQNDN